MERWHFETDTTFLLWFPCVRDVASTVLVSGSLWDQTVIVSGLICLPFLILTGSIIKHLLVPPAPDEIAQLPRGKCVVGDKSLIHQTASKHNPTADSAAPPQDYRLLCATHTLILHIVGLLLDGSPTPEGLVWLLVSIMHPCFTFLALNQWQSCFSKLLRHQYLH